MRLFIPELDNAELEKHGFEKHDIFERKEFGENLKNLVQNSGGAITIGLDSGWGNGKTTFIKMWQGHIKDDIQPIYFDAFANDYQKELFLALATEIYGLISNEDTKKKFINATKPVIKSLIRRGMRSGISTLSGGFIDGDIVDSIEKTFRTLTNQSFENITEDKKAMVDFKVFLQEFAKKQDKPIVFIIDELDRCRPDFALELIEQIKHFFSVDGITFLLVINKPQLEASIKCKYGNIDASQYLQKFVHLWLQLPRKAGKLYNDDGEKYMLKTFNEMLDNGERDDSYRTLSEIIKILQPSFREINQILTLVAISININKSVNFTERLSLVFVCCLKVCKPCLLEKIINKNISADKVFEEMGLEEIKPNASVYLHKIIRVDFANDDERKELFKQGGLYDVISREYGSYMSGSIIKKFHDDIVSLI